MQMNIDAALITRKSASLDYNTDSLNASGKIWPRESVHSENGIKAVGKSHGKPYYVLTSADAKGTAESAADLFKACVSEFSTDGTNYSESISEFFRAFAGVLDKSGYNSGSCDLAIFAGVENRVFLAKSGKARLFRYSDGFFTEAKPQMFAYEDQASNYGVCSYSDAQAGDIYVLLSGKVGAVVSESILKAIVKNADGDIKKMVSQIDSNARKNGCASAVSAIVLKVTDIESEENDDAPVAGATAAGSPVLREIDPEEENETVSEEAEDEMPEEESSVHHAHLHSHREDYYDPSEDEIDHETEETEKINRYRSRNKFGRAAVIDIVIVLAVIAVLVAVLAVKGVFRTKTDSALKEGGDIVNITSEKESTTKKNKNNKDETTTEETTTAKSVTTSATNAGRSSNNTTRSSSVNTTSSRSTTSAPVTETPATQVTEAPAPSTEAPAPVTDAPPVTEAPPATDPTPVDPDIVPDD